MKESLVTKLVKSMQQRPSSWEVYGDRATQVTADDTICIFDGIVAVTESNKPFKIKYPITTTRLEKRALRKAVAALKRTKLLQMLDTASLVLVADDETVTTNTDKFDAVLPLEDVIKPTVTPDWACQDYHKHGMDYTCPDCDMNWQRRAGRLI